MEIACRALSLAPPSHPHPLPSTSPAEITSFSNCFCRIHTPNTCSKSVASVRLHHLEASTELLGRESRLICLSFHESMHSRSQERWACGILLYLTHPTMYIIICIHHGTRLNLITTKNFAIHVGWFSRGSQTPTYRNDGTTAAHCSAVAQSPYTIVLYRSARLPPTSIEAKHFYHNTTPRYS